MDRGLRSGRGWGGILKFRSKGINLWYNKATRSEGLKGGDK